MKPGGTRRVRGLWIPGDEFPSYPINDAIEVHPKEATMLSRKAKKQVHPQIIASLSEHFTSKELIALGKFGTIVDVSAGHTLISRGDPARQAMLVLEGSVRVERSTSSFATVRRGEFIGALCLENNGSRSPGSVSIEETSVLVFSARDFDALLYTTPSLQSAVSASAECRSEEVLDLTDRLPSTSVATHPLPFAA